MVSDKRVLKPNFVPNTDEVLKPPQCPVCQINARDCEIADPAQFEDFEDGEATWEDGMKCALSMLAYMVIKHRKQMLIEMEYGDIFLEHALYVVEKTMVEYTGKDWDEIKAKAEQEIRRIDDSNSAD
jgi:hypothetical protein